ncbi:MAG: hypothetical protein B7Z55_01260 [Planctomycetales bacterium 12-60-4]|nr:MAG: hypothetical protein B7Z55_01260 [Planctomycetales bacterium 12-60-4]
MRATFRTPVTTVYAADGKVLEVKFPPESLANLDPLFASLFDVEKRKKAASQQLGLLPKKAVDVGDKWDQTVEAELGGGQTLTFGLEYAYAGPVEDNGQKLHRVKVLHKTVSYSMDPTSPSPLKVSQSDLKVNGSEGEFLLDAERGVIVRESSKVVIGGTMTFLAGTQELPGKLDLTLSSKLTLQP